METEPGVIAGRVGANLKQLRQARRVTVRQLSAFLTKLGRPLVPSGVTKIEMCTRGVDVDELVALALVLGTTPNRLLLAPEADGAELALTSEVSTTRRDAWRWATGEQPLADPLDEEGTGPSSRDFDWEAAFRRENRPNEPASPSFAHLSALGKAHLQPVLEAAREAVRNAPVTMDDVVNYLGLERDQELLVVAMQQLLQKRPPRRSSTRKTTARGGK